jgi:apolipoprotein N-acyltransferase
VAALGRVYLLSFLMAATATLLVRAALATRPRQRWGSLGLAVLIPSLTLLGGALRLASAPPLGEGSWRASVAQGNLGSRPAHEEEPLLVYERLSVEAARAGARLVVWPESAVHGLWLSDERWPREWITDLARRTGSALLVNDLTRGDGGTYRNAAVPVRPDGSIGPWYEKLHLVPFGEYVPYQGLLPFVSHFTAEVGDFRPGERLVVPEAAGRRLGILICYEAIFPEMAAAAARQGAEVLVNLTNDFWFGRSAGPLQHRDLAVLRAVETGRPFLRAANTGVSTIVDPWGRRLGELPVGREGVLVANLPVPGRSPPALRVGGVLPWTCAIVSLLSLTPTRRRRARAGTDAES